MGLETVVSYWKLDEASGQRQDVLGRNNLTPAGTVSVVAGKILSAVTGSGTLAKSTPSDGLGDFRTTWAVSFWIKPVVGGVTTITSVGGATTTLTLTANTQAIAFGGNSGFFDSLTVGAWHHVVVEAYEYPNFSTGEMYYRVRATVDNAESVVIGTFISTVTSNFASGGTSFTIASGTNVLDEVGWFSDALRFSTGIELLWNSGAGNSCPFIVPLTLNTIAGTSAVSFVTAQQRSTGFTIAGSAAVSGVAAALKETEFEILATSQVNFAANALTETGFGISGTSAVDFTATSNAATGFTISGQSSVEFSSENSHATGFTISGQSSVNFTAESVAESAFTITGSSNLVGATPGTSETAFTIAGTSAVTFVSSDVPVTTLVEGNNGTTDKAVTIDWSVCDVLELTMSASALLSIKHINLIPGKTLRVSITNDGSTADIDWDAGEAVIDWGLPGVPDVPEDGQRIWYEFFATSRTQANGRLFFSTSSNSESPGSQWYEDSTEDGTLAGEINSERTNDTFTLSHLPSSKSIVSVYRNGLRLKKGGFTRNGLTIVVGAENIPYVGDELSAVYCQ